MTEEKGRSLNPMLALARLYQKDNKKFSDVTKDITDRLNTFGMALNEAYVKENILPWIYSFLYMTMSEQILQEYLQGLVKPDARNPGPKEARFPPPADINK